MQRGKEENRELTDTRICLRRSSILPQGCMASSFWTVPTWRKCPPPSSPSRVRGTHVRGTTSPSLHVSIGLSSRTAYQSVFSHSLIHALPPPCHRCSHSHLHRLLQPSRRRPTHVLPPLQGTGSGGVLRGLPPPHALLRGLLYLHPVPRLLQKSAAVRGGDGTRGSISSTNLWLPPSSHLLSFSFSNIFFAPSPLSPTSNGANLLSATCGHHNCRRWP